MQLVILDFNRTIYDPDKKGFVEGAFDFIKNSKCKLALICKGDESRKKLIDSLKIKQYFDYIYVDNQKTKEDYVNCLRDLGIDEENAISVGDRIKKEIKYSNQADIKTIWLRQGKFKDEMPESEDEKPSFIADSYVEVKQILNNL